MKIDNMAIKSLIKALGFNPQEDNEDIYYKSYKNNKQYLIKVNFDNKKIDYGNKIKLGDLTTSNFENSENFVVLECVNRILEKGYSPECLTLEHKWPMGRKEKGKLDILIADNAQKAYLMIECKTWGEEYEKEIKKMRRDGGQLFSYYQQDKAAQYLCLYASRLNNNQIEYINSIVQADTQWKEFNNQKEIFDHWNKNFVDNGIFDDWAYAYNIEIKALTRNRLKELTKEDSSLIFNQFAEILRHNVVSDKPNAFNKIFNLFLCKIVDEDRQPDEELKFQWLDIDTHENLQKRLSDLYKQGMRDYLTKEVTDYNDEQIEEKLYALSPEVRDQIRDMFTRVRLHKNNEFAFKEVFDEKSFKENAIVVKEVVELLQPYQIRYGHKQQFLGDFFELLLSTGIKQEAGQFFTPVPIAKFIISSLPLKQIIEEKIQKDGTHILPYLIDYAAGSGHFLTESMDEIQSVISSFDTTKQKPSIASKLSSWREYPFEWAYDYIYGIELDYRLVKTAKVSCFLNGDGLANVIHADGLDSFKFSKDFKGKLQQSNREENKDNCQFDVLVANPPYSVSSFRNNLKYGNESFELYPKLTDTSSEIECLFIERAKQLLKPGGIGGIILPSTILNNPGIYQDAREILFKYFKIIAITKFGNNTFMATGTPTVTLFMKRMENSYWKVLENFIDKFFQNIIQDFTFNQANIEDYIESVYNKINKSDYISLLEKTPNSSVFDEEIITEYSEWFYNLSEIKKLQDSHAKALNKINKNEKLYISLKQKQEQEIQFKFYEYFFIKEKKRMLFWFLTINQNLVLVDVGEKTKEKEFIGYEFSERRGHEGIKLFRNSDGKLTTKLYDENQMCETKVNFYIHNMFNGIKKNIHESLKNNVLYTELNALMNFTDIEITNAISTKEFINPYADSKNRLAKIKEIFDLEYGKPLSEEMRLAGDFPVMGSNGITGYHNQYIVEGPAIIVGRKGSAGKVTYIKENCYPIDTTFYVKNKSDFPLKFIYYILLSLPLKTLSKSMGVPGLNRNDVYNIKIPVMDKVNIENKIKHLDLLYENRTKDFKSNKSATENESVFNEKFIEEIILQFRD